MCVSKWHVHCYICTGSPELVYNCTCTVSKHLLLVPCRFASDGPPRLFSFSSSINSYLVWNCPWSNWWILVVNNTICFHSFLFTYFWRPHLPVKHGDVWTIVQIAADDGEQHQKCWKHRAWNVSGRCGLAFHGSTCSQSFPRFLSLTLVMWFCFQIPFICHWPQDKGICRLHRWGFGREIPWLASISNGRDHKRNKGVVLANQLMYSMCTPHCQPVVLDVGNRLDSIIAWGQHKHVLHILIWLWVGIHYLSIYFFVT